MDEQLSFHSSMAEYCLDTNIVLNFLKSSDDEPYDTVVFADQWTHLLSSIQQYRIVAPDQVRTELKRFVAEHPRVGDFLTSFADMFVQPDSAQLDAAREIVNAYPAYGENQNRIADLMVLAVARSQGLKVITAERRASQVSRANPKLPDVGDELGLACLSFKAYLVDDDFLRQRS